MLSAGHSEVETLLKAVADIGLCPALLVYLLYRLDWRLRQMEDRLNELRNNNRNYRK